MRYILLSVACVLGPVPLLAQAPSQQQIDVLVKEALEHWQVPGAAIAIVHDDRLVYLKGFGVKELGAAGTVTQDTVFPLASCSKAMTVTLLAMLVDEGKLDWDDPVRKHLPWFKLDDPWANANVTVRDLLTHRTGLGKHEALWFWTPLTMEERARRLAFLEPTHSFRSTFEYQAIAYGAAGLVAGAAGKSTWEDLLKERLFGPLEMKSASAAYPGANKIDCASPHRRDSQGTVRVMPRYPLSQPDPAGSIHASARDLGRFLRLQLSGASQGRRLVSEESLAETQAPQIVIRHEPLSRAVNPFSHVLSYTLGWIAQDYRGRWMLMHGGTVDGFRAHLTLVPDARLGIALVNNLDRTWMNLALANTLVDRFCQLPAKDWNAYLQHVEKQSEDNYKAGIARRMANRTLNTKPTLPLAAYAGEYTDRAYGACQIRVVDGQLHWQWNLVKSRLDHFHYDTFIATENPVETVGLKFDVNQNNEVESLRVMERTFARQK